MTACVFSVVWSRRLGGTLNIDTVRVVSAELRKPFYRDENNGCLTDKTYQNQSIHEQAVNATRERSVDMLVQVWTHALRCSGYCDGRHSSVHTRHATLALIAPWSTLSSQPFRAVPSLSPSD